jgi:GNAT superfamily N-acetyltransferase
VSFIRVTQHDVAAVEAFLRERSEYVMFPLNNLVRFGLDGIDNLAPRMWRNGDGALTDVLSVTKAGMVMPYLPSGDYIAAAHALAGRDLIGIIGPMQAVRGTQAALNLATIDMELDAEEAHLTLDLDALIIPDGTTHIAQMTENLRPILTEWMVDYHINTLGITRKDAANAVPSRISREIAEDRRVVLMDGDTPVAATAFNAALPHIVQIGAVYTPPALRGKGHARRAVALHLAQVRAKGARRATLFASAPSAIAAYKAVGFKQIGDWVLAIFKTPQVAP